MASKLVLLRMRLLLLLLVARGMPVVLYIAVQAHGLGSATHHYYSCLASRKVAGVCRLPATAAASRTSWTWVRCKYDFKVFYDCYGDSVYSWRIRGRLSSGVADDAGFLELTDVTGMVDNEAWYDICRCSKINERPIYTNMGRALAQISGSPTASLRPGGSLASRFLHSSRRTLYCTRVSRVCSQFYAPVIFAERSLHVQLSVAEITTCGLP